MAASTITRTGVTLTNDTGTAAEPNGDGTLLNAAWCSTFLDRIDALFSSALTIGGLFGAEGFGTHSFSAGGTGTQALLVRNTTAGNTNQAMLQVGNDASASLTALVSYSSTWTTAGLYVANGSLLQGAGAGGLSIAATVGALRFYSGGTTERARLTSNGHFIIQGVSTNPTTDDLAASGAVAQAVAVYVMADQLVFAYNNSGTMTYIALTLDGSDTTWSHSTSAPGL